MDSIQDLIDRGDLEPAARALVSVTRHTPHEGEAQHHLARLRITAEMARTGQLSPKQTIQQTGDLAATLTKFRKAVETTLSNGRSPVDIDFRGFSPRQPQAAADDRHLRSVGWVRVGLERARSVARIEQGGRRGTGFVVKPGWLLTCHHVIPSALAADDADVQFDYEQRPDHDVIATRRATLDPETWRGDAAQDWSVVRLATIDPAPPALDVSFAPALPEGSRVSIIQHPGGRPMEIAMTANEVHRVDGDRLLYATHTVAGSSGSPVFDERWRVVAMHRLGGNVYLHEGRVYQSNEGRLLQSLKQLIEKLD